MYITPSVQLPYLMVKHYIYHTISTAAIYNGTIVDTGANELYLTQIYRNSHFIFDCVKIRYTNTHTYLSKIIVIKPHINSS